MRFTCVAQPLLQQRFELAHVFEAEVERLEAGDGRLAEIVAVEFSHGEAHVALREHRLVIYGVATATGEM